MNLLEQARRALEVGWNVIPVHPFKGPHTVMVETGHYTVNDEGRRVPAWRGFQQERVSPDLLREWFHPRRRVPGMAGVTGTVSRRVVIDLDGAAGWALLKAWGLVPSALSGGGSPHLYFPHPGWKVRTLASGSFKNPPFPGLDVRGDGGMIVLPPSVLANGRYQLLSEALLDPACLPEAVALWTGLTCPPPPELPELDPSKLRAGEDAPTLLREALNRASGARNNAGYWLARELKKAGYALEDARPVMMDYTDGVGQQDARGRHDPYTRRHALASLESAYRAPARPRLAHRSGTVTDPLDEARRVLPQLTLEERVQLARLIAATYARESEERAAGALRSLGLNPAAAREAAMQLQQGVSLPGTRRLILFLRRRR
ncbi:bifunctional DNA primase/polymerase [Deinococcus aerius]|uniref:Bifunctional DNA primase/polymerase n=1 Tax=Deinococcus aerius TaxID=200253 RepID=A0A2I9D3I1_9DEIO|nr:bifunctional DNA primase/polymerase [Deinococcus aerius]GBF04770.1 bifunctional DNA primase/polymerase [Deinococcus aerius]